MTRQGELFVYCVFGFGFGLAAGILLAPQRGAETRRRIRDKAEDSTNFMKAKIDEMNQLVETGKENLRREKERLATAVEAGRRSYRENMVRATGA